MVLRGTPLYGDRYNDTTNAEPKPCHGCGAHRNKTVRVKIEGVAASWDRRFMCIPCIEKEGAERYDHTTT